MSPSSQGATAKPTDIKAKTHRPAMEESTVVSVRSLRSTSSKNLVSRAQLQSSNESQGNKSVSSLRSALNESSRSLHTSSTNLNASARSTNAAKIRGGSKRRNSNPHKKLSDSVAPSADDSRKPANTHKSIGSGSTQKYHYSGVVLNRTVGSLTLLTERLIFRPQDRRDKDNTFAWQLEALQKHQISAAGPGDSCLLKLMSHNHPSKTVTMKFPDRSSLEDIHANLSHQLQPLRKYRRLKESLITTQRKLKEANATIDELQDTNQKLLDSCEAFAKKCKQLSEELQEQQHNEIQHYVTNDKVAELEQKLMILRPEVESLRNEKTAMAIGHEMDVQNYESRIATLEQELAEEREALEEERAVTERLLDDRQPLDELQLEVSVLAKELLRERRTVKELTEQLERQEFEKEEELWQMRRQRNNSFLEVAHVKNERDNLQRQLDQRLAEEEQLEEEDLQIQQSSGIGDEGSFQGFGCIAPSSFSGELAHVFMELQWPPGSRRASPPADLPCHLVALHRFWSSGYGKALPMSAAVGEWKRHLKCAVDKTSSANKGYKTSLMVPGYDSGPWNEIRLVLVVCPHSSPTSSARSGDESWPFPTDGGCASNSNIQITIPVGNRPIIDRVLSATGRSGWEQLANCNCPLKSVPSASPWDLRCCSSVRSISIMHPLHSHLVPTRLSKPSAPKHLLRLPDQTPLDVACQDQEACNMIDSVYSACTLELEQIPTSPASCRILGTRGKQS